jgi:hypothetical protein
MSLAYNASHVVGANSIDDSGSASFTIGSSSAGSVTSDYSFTTPTVAAVVASITPKALTTTLTNSSVSKTYDGTDAAPSGFVPEFAVTGFVANDNAATITSMRAAYNDPNVVSANRVTVAGLAIVGISGANNSVVSDYVLDADSKNISANIQAKLVTVSGLVAQSKQEDGSSRANMSNWGSVRTDVGAETLELRYGDAIFADATSGSSKIVTALDYGLLDGRNGGRASNYALTANTATTITSITPLPFVPEVVAAPAPAPSASSAVEPPAKETTNKPQDNTASANLQAADAPAVASTSATASTVSTVADTPQPVNAAPSVAISVKQVASAASSGLVTVSVSKGAAATSNGFGFALPVEIAKNPSGRAVEVSTVSGDKLPQWIRFSPETNSFKLSSVPSGGLPLQVVVNAGGQRVVIVISEQAEK